MPSNIIGMTRLLHLRRPLITSPASPIDRSPHPQTHQNVPSNPFGQPPSLPIPTKPSTPAPSRRPHTVHSLHQKENTRFRIWALVGASVVSALTFAVLLHGDTESIETFSLPSAPHLTSTRLSSSPTIASLVSPSTSTTFFKRAERIVRSAGKGSATVVTEQQMVQVKEGREDLAVWFWGRGGGFGGMGSSLGVDLGKRGEWRRECGTRGPASELDGNPLRDLAVTSNGIAAIDINGVLHHVDLSSPTTTHPGPTTTIVKNYNFTRVAYTQPDPIATSIRSTSATTTLPPSRPLPLFALTSRGDLMKIDPKAASQHPVTSSWWPFSRSTSPIQRVPFADSWSTTPLTSVAAGRHHVIALSKSGKVFTAAVDAPSSPVHEGVGAQLGREGEEVWDGKLREVEGLKGVKVVQVAAGDAFCVVRAEDGRVFAWGANTFGQLGTGYKSDVASLSEPMEVQTLWNRMRAMPKPSDAKCTFVAAGGSTAAFVVERQDKTEVCGVSLDKEGFRISSTPQPPSQRFPTSSEYSEQLHRRVPIRVSSLTVGPSHCVGVLESGAVGERFGRDALAWGLNDRGQLRRADGRRGNTGTPLWMAPVRGGSVVVDGEESVGRLQVAGEGWVRRGLWGWCKVEERFACGDGFTVMYPRVVG
ncbi:regulator of chromosome condensation 1/beta-lactamase-inhibitor protein II [Chytridium lagenaria]|nr:regulator of chromosome condensation 1/beta-lactamase-inhibitor protein II [Chytridium lagenaria]